MVRAGVSGTIKDFFLEILDELLSALRLVGGMFIRFRDEVQQAIKMFKDMMWVLNSCTSNSASKLKQTKITNTHWLPENCAVVVPQNRDFLGFIGMVGKNFVGVVHNPSRGLSIARSPELVATIH